MQTEVINDFRGELLVSFRDDEQKIERISGGSSNLQGAGVYNPARDSASLDLLLQQIRFRAMARRIEGPNALAL